MANLDIFNLDDSGSELSNNSESFLIDLDDQEQQDIIGGSTLFFQANFDESTGLQIGQSGIGTINVFNNRRGRGRR